MKPIAAVHRWRDEATQIILIATLLGMGVGLLGSLTYEALKTSPRMAGLVGFALIGAGFAQFYRLGRKNSVQTHRFHGAVAFKECNDGIKPIHIYGYELNDEICSSITALLNENAAYKKRFIAHSLDARSDHPPYRKPSFPFFQEIVISTIEYLILHELELHLNSYFVDNEIDTSTIQNLGREQLSKGILEKNKVLELFTRDFREREAFLEQNIDNKDGILVYAQGKDGAIYQRLEIELPPNSSIERNGDGNLLIKNKKFNISLSIQFDGSATYVPFDLMSDGMDLDYAPYGFLVRIETIVKASFFAFSSGNQLYEWLDSFIERMDRLISIERLIERFDLEYRNFLLDKRKQPSSLPK